ncbi:MAG: murein biosynthesis integral membrane protein MurJ [Spirochaetales bacterium]|nr:murein biosynthesis integral membrane protein MurJ [Spirochaetales bacterium]
MKKEEESLQSSTKSTMVVSSMTMISRLLGFVRVAVISAIFGAGQVADVINLTFNIPNNLRKLLAEGALSSAFIPVLSESIVKDETGNESRKIVRSIMAFQLIILIPLCILAILFAKPLINIFLAEFTEVWQVNLSVNLFRWFINYLILISISAVLMGVINSHHRFFIPSITPVLFSVFVISSILIFSPLIGPYAMVLGVLLGGVAQILFQTPSYLRLGYDYRLNFHFSDPVFKRILKQWLPVVASSSVFTITQVVAYRFSSGLEEGSTSALSNAIVFWQLPMGIFSASITTVLFPKMSRQSALDDFDGLRESIQYGVRFLLVFLIPSAVFLILFGEHTIELALQRGEFTAENTNMTAHVLITYSLGLFSVGLFNFLQRFFYSFKNYRIPFYVSLFTGCFDIILSLILKETSLRVSGLAAANTIAFSTGALLFFILMLKKLKKVEWAKIIITLGKVLLSSSIGFVVLYFFKELSYQSWSAFSFWFKLLIYTGGTLIYCLTVLFLYKVFKIEMLDFLLKRGKRK